MELQYAKQNKKPSLSCNTHYQAHLINKHDESDFARD